MHLVELIIAGLLLGFLNTVSSGGSVISLPLLVALGYPPVTANATNRVPVALGLMIAIWQFEKAGAIPWREIIQLIPVILIGTFIGTQISLLIPAASLGLSINIAVAIALALLLIRPRRWLDELNHQGNQVALTPGVIFLLFIVSIWNGFIVLDAGTYTLLILTLVAGLTIKTANILKVVLMGVSGLFSLLIYSGYDEINWLAAIPLALGSVAGSFIGSKLALGSRAKQWIYWSLVTAISAELLFKLARFFFG